MVKCQLPKLFDLSFNFWYICDEILQNIFVVGSGKRSSFSWNWWVSDVFIQTLSPTFQIMFTHIPLFKKLIPRIRLLEPLTKFSKKGKGGIDIISIFRGWLLEKRGVTFIWVLQFLQEKKDYKKMFFSVTLVTFKR